MYLHHLRLTDFRNYRALDLTLGPGSFVFVGRNAQGKTNLLEAIAMLATSRSFRTANDREVVHWDAPGRFARIEATITRQRGPLTVELLVADPTPAAEPGMTSRVPPAPTATLAEPLLPPLPPNLRKRIRVQGRPRRAIDLIGEVTAVTFVPADLDLVAGSPMGRRRFLDTTLCQVDAHYCRSLARYHKVLAQRAALLRSIRDSGEDPRGLTYWDEQLVELATPLMLARRQMIEQVDDIARRYHATLSGDAALLRIVYRPSFAGALTAGSPEELAAALREQLHQLRRREIAQGVCLLGPHRDDLGFMLADRDMTIYGSRGQQRTIALALKLAELDFMRARTGDEPILLLDDVLSELDEDRRAYLLGLLAQREQVLLTTTDPASAAPALPGAHIFSVHAGQVTPAKD
jgi:DNA replication and repair protein RecF